MALNFTICEEASSFLATKVLVLDVPARLNEPTHSCAYLISKRFPGASLIGRRYACPKLLFKIILGHQGRIELWVRSAALAAIRGKFCKISAGGKEVGKAAEVALG